MTKDINIVAIVKDSGERVIILFDDSNQAEALRTVGRWASDPGLSFTWYDAAKVAQKIRKMVRVSAVNRIA